MVAKCPSDNTQAIEQGDFWDGSFTPHKIGWIISGSAAALTCLLAFITICGHCRNYNRPLEQRQVIRVILLPPVYGVVSFLSYRYFRSYEYYAIGEEGYEALAIAAFLMLMMQYIGDNVDEQKAVFSKKEKKPLPLPFCCFRYRPSKAYFMVLLKWSVIQYVIIGPAISIAGIITEAYEVYCPSSLSYKYAYVYLLGVEFVSVSIALYGLFTLYVLIKDDLKGKRPLAKFASIKLVIFLTYYQSFVFDLLKHYNKIKATEYWTQTNISNGLNALCISLEMLPIAAFQLWAFNWKEYSIGRVTHPSGKANRKGKTNMFMSLMHALNFSDFLVELWHELRFVWDRMRGKEYTREDMRFGKLDFVGAFNANEDSDFKGSPAPLPLQTRTPSDAEKSEAAVSSSSNGIGQQYYGMDEAYQSNRHLVTSETPPIQPQSRQPVMYHQSQYPSHLLYPSQQHRNAAYAPQQQQYDERPRSWEPQAL